METWKIIEGFGNYSVSDHGNVKNNKTGRILKNCLNGHGYAQVQLCKDQKRSGLKVHRLVALLFLPNLDGKPMVDHIDNNILNNNINILRWATYSKNQHNRLVNINNKCGHKGVIWHKGNKKWHSQITVLLPFI